MKNCPNCGAENDNKALRCILCEFEFDVEEGSDMEASEDTVETAKADNNNETGFDVSKAIEASKNEQNTTAVPVKSDFVSSPSSNGMYKAIAAIASVLVIGGGIAGGVFLMKNKKSPTDTPLNAGESSSAAVTTVTDAASTAAAATESKTTAKAVTSAVTEAQTTKAAEPTTQPTAVDQNAVKDAYIRKLTEFVKSDEFNAYDYPSKYALYDIDNNGVEELIIQYQAIIGNSEILYYYKNGEYTEVAHCYESSFQFDPNSHLVQWYAHGGGLGRYIVTLSEQGISTEEIGVVYPESYSHNKSGISKAEYDALNNKYDAYNWVSPSFNLFTTLLPESVVYAKPRETYAFIGAVNITDGVLNVREGPSTDSKVLGGLSRGTIVRVYKLDGYSDWYKIEEDEKNIKGYVSAQYIIDSDTFKRNNNTYSEYTDESALIAKGRTKLNDGGVLNVRKSPSTDAEIVATVPKDHYVGIISVSGDWYYIKYYADTNSPIYYGYVSSQFIEVI